jgi:putative ABC transport system permease protein
VWRAVLKSLLARKLRLLLTAFSIVIGIAFVAGTYVLTDTMDRAFDELFATTTADIDVVVRATSAFEPGAAGNPGGSGNVSRISVPASVLTTVQEVPGVGSAYGGVLGYAQMVDPVTDEAIGGFGPPTMGVNWQEGSSVLVLRRGEPPSAGDQVVIDAGTADAHDLTVGDRVNILFEGPPGDFTISGIAGFGDADNLGGATLAAFETETAQRVLGREGVFDEISVEAEEGVTPSALAARIGAVLPDRVEAITATTAADEQAEALQEGLGFFRIFLLVFAFISLFVGAFIIFNTFSIIVAQRTRELALLRALGASRRQVMTSVIAEAFLIGLIASIVGIFVGIGVALGIQWLLEAFGIDLPSTSMQLRPRTIVVSLVVGTLVTVTAAVFPARRASRVAPVEALRDVQQQEVGRGLGRRAAIGTVVLGVGIVGVLYGLFALPANAASIVGFGAAATFIGVAALSPLLARPLASWIGAPLRALGVQGKLGRENAKRNPRRTASTAAALMIGLGLVSMVAILSASLKASFDRALQSTLKADFTLATSSFVMFSPDVAARVRELPEVGATSEFRPGVFRVDGATSFLTAVEPSTIAQVAELGITEGSTEALGADTVLVFEDVAADEGWRVGDALPAEFATVGDRPLEIVGIYSESLLVQSDYVIALETYEDVFPEQLDSIVLIKGAEGVPTDDVERAVTRAVEPFSNIDVQDQAEFREQQAGFIDQLLGLVTALLAMAILIALFGIVNTLGLSIFERTRELGLLRAVGMGRRQVRWMIRWESVIIAVIGAVLGIAIGVFFGWALRKSLEPEGVTDLAIPVGQLLIYLVFAALAGVLAAIWPARRAARLDVLQSIAYE